MTLRSRRSRGRRLAALLAVAAMLLAALPATAATSVEITARPLLLGRYQGGGWLAVQVDLVNDGAPTQGYVAADSPDGTARRFVELPAGARKSVALYVRPQGFQRQIEVRFEATEGSAVTTADIRAFERSSSQVAIVGDGGGNLRPQLAGQADSGLPEPISLVPGDFPERPEPLDGLAGVIWAADSSVLAAGQQRSLERWVAGGGQLVVLGGPDWQARTAGFADLLPVEGLSAVDDADLAPLATWAGAEQAPTEAGTDSSASGSLRPGAVALAGDDGAPLLSMVARGAGRVIYVSVDMATPAYRGWEGGPSLWARLLPTNLALEDFGGGFPIEEETANAMSQALGNLPSLEVPPAELLLLVILGYIVLIGPVSYVLLRRMDRRELAWVTAPLLVIVFTACSFGIGTTLKGSTIILNQITLVRSAVGGGAASVQTYAGLFSPSRSSYDLTVEADALLAPLRTSTGFAPPNQQTTRYVTEQGDPAHLRGLSVGVFGFQALRSDAIVPYQPSLEVTWQVSGTEITGTVTNVGTVALDDVALAAPTGGEMIGDLQPGQSAEFTHSTVNFNGSSASDQIYGFGKFDTASDEQRRNTVRRQVIDSLVGFAGFFPGGGLQTGIGRGKGPVIIGWHTGEGPAPVTVDGLTVQRHAQVVEVVSGRPLLSAGDVTISPAEMSVRVLSTDGNVSVQPPGTVSMGAGAGEAVFGVSLPLEAAGLVPNKITIVTAPDPSMVLQDPGGFQGGFMLPGYTLSVRDATSGAWLDLGDPSTASSFAVADPAAVMGGDGRIEVRLVGEGGDAGNPAIEFQQSTLYLSASVEGTLSR